MLEIGINTNKRVYFI